MVSLQEAAKTEISTDMHGFFSPDTPGMTEVRIVESDFMGEFMGLEGIAREIVKKPEEKIIKCPRCGVEMKKEEVEMLGSEIIIDVCPKCQSIWFDNDELAKVLGNKIRLKKIVMEWKDE